MTEKCCKFKVGAAIKRLEERDYKCVNILGEEGSKTWTAGNMKIEVLRGITRRLRKP